MATATPDLLGYLRKLQSTDPSLLTHEERVFRQQAGLQAARGQSITAAMPGATSQPAPAAAPRPAAAPKSSPQQTLAIVQAQSRQAAPQAPRAAPAPAGGGGDDVMAYLRALQARDAATLTHEERVFRQQAGLQAARGQAITAARPGGAPAMPAGAAPNALSQRLAPGGQSRTIAQNTAGPRPGGAQSELDDAVLMQQIDALERQATDQTDIDEARTLRSQAQLLRDQFRARAKFIPGVRPDVGVSPQGTLVDLRAGRPITNVSGNKTPEEIAHDVRLFGGRPNLQQELQSPITQRLAAVAAQNPNLLPLMTERGMYARDPETGEPIKSRKTAIRFGPDFKLSGAPSDEEQQLTQAVLNGAQDPGTLNRLTELRGSRIAAAGGNPVWARELVKNLVLAVNLFMWGPAVGAGAGAAAGLASGLVGGTLVGGASSNWDPKTTAITAATTGATGGLAGWTAGPAASAANGGSTAGGPLVTEPGALGVQGVTGSSSPFLTAANGTNVGLGPALASAPSVATDAAVQSGAPSITTLADRAAPLVTEPGALGVQGTISGPVFTPAAGPSGLGPALAATPTSFQGFQPTATEALFPTGGATTLEGLPATQGAGIVNPITGQIAGQAVPAATPSWWDKTLTGLGNKLTDPLTIAGLGLTGAGMLMGGGNSSIDIPPPPDLPPIETPGGGEGGGEGGSGLDALRDIFPSLGDSTKFDALIDQILRDTADIPKPDDATIQKKQEEIQKAQLLAIAQDYEKASKAILEQANFDGTNPAGRLAELDRARLLAEEQVRSNSFNQALALLQMQSAAAMNRITPAIQIAQLLNPFQALGPVAGLIGSTQNAELSSDTALAIANLQAQSQRQQANYQQQIQAAYLQAIQRAQQQAQWRQLLVGLGGRLLG